MFGVTSHFQSLRGGARCVWQRGGGPLLAVFLVAGAYGCSFEDGAISNTGAAPAPDPGGGTDTGVDEPESPSPEPPPDAPDDGPTEPDGPADDEPAPAPAPVACPPGPSGLSCLFALWDRADRCEPETASALTESINRRIGELPAWYEGRALFVSGQPSAFAGSFNAWDPDQVIAEEICGTGIFAAEAEVATGHYIYKRIDEDVWRPDPLNRAFAYDDFAGNESGTNSVLNTYDSGVGHLESPSELLCSAELGNCRPFTTYVPPGYGDPANAERVYPALFMHDGQNIFDDTDCCFGHTGWEINRTLDELIGSGRVDPVVVVGFDHGGESRRAEYGYSRTEGGLRELFMEFQVGQVQPKAATYWRLDPQQYFVAGSSMGGLLSLALALSQPELYAGAASLSGAFWVGRETGSSVFDLLDATGKVDMPLYLDHGGSEETGADFYGDNVDMRDALVEAGWLQGDAPVCAPGPATLCYLHDVDAAHDELAWRARFHHALIFFFGSGLKAP